MILTGTVKTLPSGRRQVVALAVTDKFTTRIRYQVADRLAEPFHAASVAGIRVWERAMISTVRSWRRREGAFSASTSAITFFQRRRLGIDAKNVALLDEPYPGCVVPSRPYSDRTRHGVCIEPTKIGKKELRVREAALMALPGRFGEQQDLAVHNFEICLGCRHVAAAQASGRPPADLSSRHWQGSNTLKVQHPMSGRESAGFDRKQAASHRAGGLALHLCSVGSLSLSAAAGLRRAAGCGVRS